LRQLSIPYYILPALLASAIGIDQIVEAGIRMSSSTTTLTNPERTALIPKSQSQVVVSYTDEHGDGDQESIEDGKGGREVEVYKPGKSSFTQTVRIVFVFPSLLFKPTGRR
jgi:hypothetical protein